MTEDYYHHLEQYQLLKEERARQKKALEHNKELIKEERHRMGTAFRQQHKKAFILLDTLFVAAIILHLGALAITNAVVFKVEPATELFEVNPIQADAHGFEKKISYPTYAALGLIFVGWLWFLMWYLYLRATTRTKTVLRLLYLWNTFLFLAFAYDFTNDLGYFIGKVWWGI